MEYWEKQKEDYVIGTALRDILVVLDYVLKKPLKDLMKE